MDLKQAIARIKQLEAELAAEAAVSARQQLEITTLQKTVEDKDTCIAQQQSRIAELKSWSERDKELKELAQKTISRLMQQVADLQQAVKQEQQAVKQEQQLFMEQSKHVLIMTLLNTKELEKLGAERFRLQQLCEQQEMQLQVMEQLLSVHMSSDGGALPASIKASPVTVAPSRQNSGSGKAAAPHKLAAVKITSKASKVVTAAAAAKQPAAGSVQGPGTPTVGSSRATSDSGNPVMQRVNSSSSNWTHRTSSGPSSGNSPSSSTTTDSGINSIFSSWWSSAAQAANKLMEPADNHAAARWW